MRKLSALLFALVLVCSTFTAAQTAAATAAPATDNTPKVGDPAPTFKLESNEGSAVSLSDYKGKWVVLYFYPKDMTSGCTIEAHNFQRDLEKYSKINATILGVSVDSVGSHKEFCAKESLTFKLLADVDKKIVTAYGSSMTYKDNVYAARNTFIISPDGKIAKVFLKVNASTHSDEVLAALAELQAAYKPPAMPKKK